jgi:CHRD domain
MRLRSIALVLTVAVAAPAAALAAGSASGEFEAEAYLAGKSEVPKGAPTGSGTVNIKIKGTKVCWKFTKIKGIGTPLAAHIHRGKAGVSGPVVVPFGAKYKAAGCQTTTAAMAAAIKAKPSNYYANVHTAKYPAGAIRGQLHAGD